MHTSRNNQVWAVVVIALAFAATNAAAHEGLECFHQGQSVLCPHDVFDGTQVPEFSTTALFSPPSIFWNLDNGGTLAISVEPDFQFTPFMMGAGDDDMPGDDDGMTGGDDGMTGGDDEGGVTGNVFDLLADDINAAKSGSRAMDDPDEIAVNGAFGVAFALDVVDYAITGPMNGVGGAATADDQPQVNEDFYRELAGKRREGAEEYRELARRQRRFAEETDNETVRESSEKLAEFYEEQARRLDESAEGFEEEVDKYRFPDPHDREIVLAGRERAKAYRDLLEAQASGDQEAIDQARKAVAAAEQREKSARDAKAAGQRGEPSTARRSITRPDPLAVALVERFGNSRFIHEVAAPAVHQLEQVFDQDTVDDIIRSAFGQLDGEDLIGVEGVIGFLDRAFEIAAERAESTLGKETAAAIRAAHVNFFHVLLTDPQVHLTYRFEARYELKTLTNHLIDLLRDIRADIDGQVRTAMRAGDFIGHLNVATTRLTLDVIPIPGANAVPALNSIGKVLEQLTEEMSDDPAAVVDAAMRTITVIEQLLAAPVVANNPRAVELAYGVIADAAALVHREATRVADQAQDDQKTIARIVADQAQFTEAKYRIAGGEAVDALRILDGLDPQSPADIAMHDYLLIQAVTQIEQTYDSLPEAQQAAIDLDELAKKKTDAFAEYVEVTSDTSVAIDVARILENDGRIDDAIDLLDGLGERIADNPVALAEMLRLRIKATGADLTDEQAEQFLGDIPEDQLPMTLAVALLDLAAAGDRGAIDAIDRAIRKTPGLSDGDRLILDAQIAIARVDARIAAARDITTDNELDGLIDAAIQATSLLDPYFAVTFKSVLVDAQNKVNVLDAINNPDAPDDTRFDQLALAALGLGQYELAAKALNRHFSDAEVPADFTGYVIIAELLTAKLADPATSDEQKQKIETFFKLIDDRAVIMAESVLKQRIELFTNELERRNEIIREAEKIGDTATANKQRDALYEGLNELRDFAEAVAMLHGAGDTGEDRDQTVTDKAEEYNTQISNAITDVKGRFLKMGITTLADGSEPGSPRLTHLQELTRRFHEVKDTDPQEAFRILVEIRQLNADGEIRVLANFLDYDAMTTGIGKGLSLFVGGEAAAEDLARLVGQEGAVAGALKAASLSAVGELTDDQRALLEQHGFIANGQYVMPDHVELHTISLGTDYVQGSTYFIDNVINPTSLTVLAVTILAPAYVAGQATALVSGGLGFAAGEAVVFEFLVNAIIFQALSRGAEIALVDPHSFGASADFAANAAAESERLLNTLAILGIARLFNAGTRFLQGNVLGTLAQDASLSTRLNYRISEALFEGAELAGAGVTITGFEALSGEKQFTAEEIANNIIVDLIMRNPFAGGPRDTSKPATRDAFGDSLARADVPKATDTTTAALADTTRSADRSDTGVMIDSGNARETSRFDGEITTVMPTADAPADTRADLRIRVADVQAIPRTDADTVLNNIDKQGLAATPRAGEPGDAAFFKDVGLEPRHKLDIQVEAEGESRTMTFHLSDPFIDKDGRIVFVGFRANGDGSHTPITLYQSNSHGLFRVLTSRPSNGKIGKGQIEAVFVDRVTEKPLTEAEMASHGLENVGMKFGNVNEASADFVAEAQPALFEIVRQQGVKRLSEADTDRAMYGHVEFVDLGNIDTSLRIGRGEPMGEFELANGGVNNTLIDVLGPQQLPDMSRVIVEFTMPTVDNAPPGTIFYEGAQVKIVPSFDNSLRFMALKDVATGKVTVATIQDADASISVFGTRTEAIKTDLTQPLIDYDTQISVDASRLSTFPQYGVKGEYRKNLDHGNDLTRYIEANWDGSVRPQVADAAAESSTPSTRGEALDMIAKDMSDLSRLIREAERQIAEEDAARQRTAAEALSRASQQFAPLADPDATGAALQPDTGASPDPAMAIRADMPDFLDSAQRAFQEAPTQSIGPDDPMAQQAMSLRRIISDLETQVMPSPVSPPDVLGRIVAPGQVEQVRNAIVDADARASSKNTPTLQPPPQAQTDALRPPLRSEMARAG